MSALVEEALAHAIAAEEDRGRQGVVLVVRKNFDRRLFFKLWVRHCMEGGYDPKHEDPPTALICVRSPRYIEQLMEPPRDARKEMPRGNLLTPQTRQRDVGNLTYATYPVLQVSKTDWDAFDFVVISAFTVGEFDRFRATFASLVPAFTVLILTEGMYKQGELSHWPHLGEPYISWPPRQEQPAPPGE